VKRPPAAALAEWCQDLDDLAKRPEEIVNADMAKHISTLAHALSRKGAGRAPDAAALETPHRATAPVVSGVRPRSQRTVHQRVDGYAAEEDGMIRKSTTISHREGNRGEP
jgi:hypothetical protein